ncbi:hypothetical protein HRED_07906 [Candidatus Haloredivivus sp. G17]|nr:hypothetical protein HRED_07906 [Candidatus Haloredivivus sp. G17]
MSQDIEARAKLTDEKRKEQFQDLKQYLDEEVPDSVTEKTGNSAVTRLAIKNGSQSTLRTTMQNIT